MLQALFALFLVATPSSERATGPVNNKFESPTRATFAVWPSHGDFEPSADGRLLYFTENGPDGLVLRSANLQDGTVQTVLKARRDYVHLAAIPTDSIRLAVAWQAGLGAASPYQVALLDLRTGDELPIDVGDPGGDGRLRISPSGKYLATGVAVAAGPAGSWFPSQISIFSLVSGNKEYSYRVPAGADQTIAYGWSASDRLTIWGQAESTSTSPSLSQGSRDFGTRVVVQSAEGHWNPTSSKEAPVMIRPSSQELRYPQEPFMFQKGTDSASAAISRDAVFKSTDGKFRGFNLSDRSIAVRESPGKDGWAEVEVVTLKWK